MRYKYNTDCLNQSSAIEDFLLNRDNIERMHKSKIKVIKMTRQPFFYLYVGKLYMSWRTK